MAFNLLRRFNKLFNLPALKLHNAVKKSIIDPVNHREDSRNIRARNTANFRYFIMTKCLKR